MPDPEPNRPDPDDLEGRLRVAEVDRMEAETELLRAQAFRHLRASSSEAANDPGVPREEAVRSVFYREEVGDRSISIEVRGYEIDEAEELVAGMLALVSGGLTGTPIEDDDG